MDREKNGVELMGEMGGDEWKGIVVKQASVDHIWAEQMNCYLCTTIYSES